MNVLIVDDEPLARNRLERMLEAMDGVTVAGQAGSAREAQQRIAELQPDVVLLDIRMRGTSGLELVASSKDLPPVIFTTAYDQYAVEAFKVSAIDYLLKPISPERLREALDKVHQRQSLDQQASIRALLEKLEHAAEGDLPIRLQARCGATTRLFDVSEVTRIYASEKYALFRHDNQEYLLDDSLNALEKRLASTGFFRAHRGELINLAHVRALRATDGTTTAELSDGQEAVVSRRSVASLKKRLGIR